MGSSERRDVVVGGGGRSRGEEAAASSTTCGRSAGELAQLQADAARAAALERSRWRYRLGRLVGARTEERAWRIGAAGERLVGEQLGKLTARDPRWTVLHAVEVGTRGSDIDHVVIGPGGVFTLNTKHHPGARIWVGGNTFMVDGSRVPYVRNSRHEAARAGRLLALATGVDVTVRPVIVPVRAQDVVVKEQPADVAVVPRGELRRWLRRQPTVLDDATVAVVAAAAGRSATWRS